MSRSVNLVILVGNLTRDPQMRYTPNGNAVANFSVATNRTWLTEGKEQEAVDYHNVVVWNKLAETCNNLLSKGRKVFVRGRLTTRSWDDAASGQKKYRTEIIAEEVLFLDAPRDREPPPSETDTASVKAAPAATKSPTDDGSSVNSEEENVDAEEIPF